MKGWTPPRVGESGENFLTYSDLYNAELSAIIAHCAICIVMTEQTFIIVTEKEQEEPTKCKENIF